MVAGSAAAVGAPIMADAANAAPAAAKSAVVRNFVARTARLFSVDDNNIVVADRKYQLGPLFDRDVSKQTGRNRDYIYDGTATRRSIYRKSVAVPDLT
jgi:hypothetical protein